MPEYNVHTTGYVSKVETIEADSPEEAIAASEAGSVSLCHQCSREWDSGGDPEVSAVTDADGETVWELEALKPVVVDRAALREQIFDEVYNAGSPPMREWIDREDLYVIADAVLAVLYPKATEGES